MRRRLIVAAAILLAIGGLAACQTDPESTLATTTSNTVATTTTAAPTTTTEVALEAPADPIGAAHQIAAAEAALRTDGLADSEYERWGRVQQLAYRRWSTHPDWDGAVTGALDATIRDVAVANMDATRKLRSMIPRPKDSWPEWTIVRPAPAAELTRYYREAAGATGVPWHVLASIHLVETRMGRIQGLSEAGAQGPMQFMPATWEAYGSGDVHDNRDAIFAAGRLLAANGAATDLAAAVYRYNRDQRYVDAVLAYSSVMADDERAYRGYWAWQVFYAHVRGDTLLPEGWAHPAEPPV